MNRFRIFLISILFVSCFAGIRKELNYSSDSIAFYSFENDQNTPAWLERNASYLKNEQRQNFKNLISDALFQMGNRNDSLVNDTALRIFPKELGSEIAQRSFDKFEASPRHVYQLWILKKEDPINPGRRIRRTVFLLYPTSESIHFLFYELNQFIDFQTPYTFQDWSNYSLSESKPKSSLEIFIPDSAIGTLSYYKDELGEEKKFHVVLKTNSNPTKDVESKEGKKETPSKDVEKRLIELKNLLDKKLISEEEYKKKREEILKSL
ncbi:LA_1326/LA_4305 family lipoprotein [Leptospira yasudae]|uniref:LA_1326/LA_4305 family lipoprotein n=1 Tax=Leptospira yasudae TaxID=2202201 RepID=UPI0010912BDD|nr:SHOCT domain-containing protein [Leptospira yasudae]MBW0433092.1 SHOCT domain-containing protein [Leptospira yasudae]TGN00944.1 SHOCT domain-containing protein [Leptospira yasudae]